MNVSEQFRAHRSERTTVYAVVCWAAVFCVYALCVKAAIAKLSPPMSEAAKSKGTLRDQLSKDIASCIVAITTHTFLGPMALYLSISYNAAGYPASLSPFLLEQPRPFDVTRELWCCRVGEMFTGNILYQLIFWLLRWETGIEMLLHHIGFFVAGYLILDLTCFGKLASGAMSMEVSSVFLSVHLMTRQIDGKRCALVSDLAAAVFALTFLGIRIFWYGYVVAEFNYTWFLEAEKFPPNISMVKASAAHLIFTLGWVLQLYWSKLVVSKVWRAARAMMGKERLMVGRPRKGAFRALVFLALAVLSAADEVAENATQPDRPSDITEPQQGQPESRGLDGQVGSAAESETCGENGVARSQISAIRHTAAVIAGFADGAMAQLPGASAVVPAIQAAMIFAIALQYGCYLDLGTALAVSTFLGSEYVKMSLVSHAIGWIPVAGNLIKTALSVVMTEGIGTAAEKMLSCPAMREDLLDKAAREEPSETLAEEGQASQVREYFHVISEFLSSSEVTPWSSTTAAAREVWHRVESIFRKEDQVKLLAKVHEARNPEDLVALAHKYSWNLQVLEASLLALRDRFPHELACTDVDSLARRFWSSQADGEVKAVSAPHLLHCWSRLPLPRRRAAALLAAELVAEATRMGGHAAVLPRALEVLKEGTRPQGGTELLEDFGLPTFLEALLKALVRGEASACVVLRRLLGGLPAQKSSQWLALRHLQQLDLMDNVAGAESCLPSLHADIKKLLTADALPEGTETPQSIALAATGKVDPFAALVGQQCAVRRLMQSPGYVRLRKKGIQRPGVPLVLLMTGPSGTGKTMAARTMAEVIHGRPIQELEASGRFRLFPMNQFRMLEDQKTFFGPPRGIQGSGDLPDLVRQHPDAVIVLDEIEKAHSDFARALLTVFGEYGTVYDPRTGRDYPAANATFILTSNLAKELILKHPVSVAKSQGRAVETWQKLPLGADSDPDCAGYAKLRDAVDAELSHPPAIDREHGFFRESEIRGRLTDVLPFLPFSPEEVEKAVRGFLASESKAFSQHPSFQNVELAWSPEVVRYFAKLYMKKPDEGLRAVNKELQAQVRDLLERSIEAGLVARGAIAALRLDEGSKEARLDLRAVLRVREAEPTRATAEAEIPVKAEPKDEETSDNFFSTVTALLSGDWINESSWSWTSAEKPARSGTEWDWQHDWEWQPDLEWHSEWDWQRVWERLFLILWEWRFPLVVTATLLIVVASAGMAAPVAAPAATVSVGAAAAPVFGAAGGSAAVGATAAAVSSWMLALIQVTGSSASVAVPGLTFYYAWKNRHYVEAAIFGALSLALCPYAWRVYCAASSLAKQMAPKPPKPLSSKAPQKIRGAKTKLPRGDFKLKLTDSDPQAHPIEFASPLEAGAVGQGSAATSEEKGETEPTGADAVQGGGAREASQSPARPAVTGASAASCQSPEPPAGSECTEKQEESRDTGEEEQQDEEEEDAQDLAPAVYRCRSCVSNFPWAVEVDRPVDSLELHGGSFKCLHAMLTFQHTVARRSLVWRRYSPFYMILLKCCLLKSCSSLLAT
ncbi:CLPB [Symbiodinium necroappetens]|uniref:CLPB protein n=1 Tax=Symbiodinium necroappetens TaxID=1628268 RepID=A0A812VDG0_9DINO|nr:CLPB [Symbiodinium necroappetens]